MLRTFLQSFSFIPHIASEELIFFNIFREFSFWLPIKLRSLDKKYMFGREPLTNISKKNSENTVLVNNKEIYSSSVLRKF